MSDRDREKARGHAERAEALLAGADANYAVRNHGVSQNLALAAQTIALASAHSVQASALLALAASEPLKVTLPFPATVAPVPQPEELVNRGVIPPVATSRSRGHLWTKSDCVFCGLINQSNPVIEQTAISNVVTFIPLRPVTEGHRLFAPRYHRECFGPEAADAVASCTRAAYLWQRTLGRGQHWNLIVNNGADATQTVDHVHVHLVPRVKGDGLELPWTSQKRH